MKLTILASFLFTATCAFESLRHLQDDGDYSRIVALDFLDYAPNITENNTAMMVVSRLPDNNTVACVKVGGEAVEEQGLILGDCTSSSGVGEGWRLDEDNLLHSQEDDTLCVQAGRTTEPDDGKILRLFPCNNTVESQLWYHKEGADNSLRSYFYRSLCVVWNGVIPQLEEDDVLLNWCDDVDGRIGWDMIAMEE